jgi:hypothetical protein
MSTPLEEQERIKSIYAEQEARLARYTIQERVIDAVADGIFKKKPTLLAALRGDECFDKKAVWLADQIANLASEIETVADSFNDPRAT